ncbi:xylulokinase [Staphylococcus caprae]|uniref:xylulokinase n=1 Tax=Staphylococcus caprae TaxID=29380 RepID=UPI001F590073|nr:xylulokinase [Staphylococcus caprae]MCI2955328.1 xylulokinase [Staphylococcus caprae]
MEEVVLGIDLGTSAIKIIAVNHQGEVLDTVSEPLELFQDQPGYSEQNPDDWYESTKRGIQRITSSQMLKNKIVKGLSFSGQMHGLIILDKQGKPLRRAILWNDTRNSEQCRQIKEIYGERLNYNPILEGFTLPKMLWVQQHEPDIWEQVHVFMLPKDYLRYCLTDQIHMEYSDTASTLLLNPQTNQWTKEVGARFNIHDIYPPLVHSHECVGYIKSSLAKELGFESDVAVYAGGGDNACGAIGAGVINDKEALCSVGTSGVVLNVEYNHVTAYDHNLHFFNHSIPDTYYAMGVTLAAGYSLNWLKKTFFENDSFETILKNAETAKLGANGLLFAPYLAGERTPHGDSQIRGSFIGISGQHTKADFARAVVEGITYSLYDSIKLMREAGHEINSITSIGGGAKSKFWLQLQADIFNMEVKKLKHEEGPSMGAAMLAAYGLGWYESIEACVASFIKVEEIFKPNKEKHQQYKKYHDIYQRIYHQTKHLTEDLLKISK